ncbi:hypothetical protein C8J57DRAFT_1227165 [Mycena rebaudengoi]|nr:hypothetical protein C8J57DRAFT_1227165 [Mycena rebaudengoi]
MVFGDGLLVSPDERLDRNVPNAWLRSERSGGTKIIFVLPDRFLAEGQPERNIKSKKIQSRRSPETNIWPNQGTLDQGPPKLPPRDGIALPLASMKLCPNKIHPTHVVLLHDAEAAVCAAAFGRVERKKSILPNAEPERRVQFSSVQSSNFRTRVQARGLRGLHARAVRGDLNGPKVKAAKEGAFKATVEWLIEHL